MVSCEAQRTDRSIAAEASWSLMTWKANEGSRQTRRGNAVRGELRQTGRRRSCDEQVRLKVSAVKEGRSRDGGTYSETARELRGLSTPLR
jgi:hypothetical protein